jgi:hypothetical protein
MHFFKVVKRFKSLLPCHENISIYKKNSFSMMGMTANFKHLLLNGNGSDDRKTKSGSPSKRIFLSSISDNVLYSHILKVVQFKQFIDKSIRSSNHERVFQIKYATFFTGMSLIKFLKSPRQNLFYHSISAIRFCN